MTEKHGQILVLMTHHIGKIVINPNNTNEIIVGSTGHLYSNSKQRGIFKSTDNGLLGQTLYLVMLNRNN